jgi:hypothetical protein
VYGHIEQIIDGISFYVIKKPPKQAWVVRTQPLGWAKVPKCQSAKVSD